MKRVHARVASLWVLTLGIFFLMVSFSGGSAKAEDVSGTWVSGVSGEGYFDHTYPADFHYDATLTLTESGGRVSGTSRLTCSKVDVNVAGWESAKSAVGKTSSYSVSGTVTSSGVVLVIQGYSFPLTVSGGKMTGSGQYTDTSGTVNSWRFDLKGGQGSLFGLGDMAGLTAAASVLGIAGAAAGLAVSSIPAPRPVTPQGSYPQAARGPPSGGQQAIAPRGWGRKQPVPWSQINTYPVGIAPGDERIYEPQPFTPISPDPGRSILLDGSGTQVGPPDKAPPPNPPRGDEKITDNNPSCPNCHQRTMPSLGRSGWRWWCRSCALFPWGE